MENTVRVGLAEIPKPCQNRTAKNHYKEIGICVILRMVVHGGQ